MIIFLLDLQNSYYRYIRNSVPINLGFIASYLKKHFGKAIDIHLFRKFEEVYEALKHTTPDLAAFGSYSWNTSLTLNTIDYLRKCCPNILIAVGGPDISPLKEVTCMDLSANPQVDFYIPNEGEGPMYHLVNACLSSKSPRDIRQTHIKGCLCLDRASGKVLGSVIDRFEDDINEIPSPYLDGLMDRFLENPDYLPIIQTLRGCPYSCTFCVSGKKIWNKIKTFNIFRVKAEIDYIAKRAASSYLRFAEENFGLLKRDEQIAEYLIAQRERTHFPSAISMYTDKHPTKRIKKILLMFRDLLPFCISFQSMTPQVLKNIKRNNLKDSSLQKAVRFAQENDLLLVTELIFGLPGETMQSFLDSVDKLVYYRFESIGVNQLRILKGTEMALPADREAHGVKTLFAMSENGYTRHTELENIEIDEWVIGNRTLSKEEYFETNRFIFLLDFFHCRSTAKELLFFFLNYGVRVSELLMGILERPDKCQILCTKADKFVNDMSRLLHTTPEGARQYIIERSRREGLDNIKGIYRLEDSLMIEIMLSGQFDTVLDELCITGCELYYQRNGSNDSGFEEALATLREVVSKTSIALDRPSSQEIIIKSAFDLVAWVKSKYKKRLDQYRCRKPQKTALRIREMRPYFEIWNSDMTILERYQRHFATLNSSNRRRFITVPNSIYPSAAIDTC